MPTKTPLIGKADYLEDSIARMTERLATAGFHLAFSTALNPVPYIYSIHVKHTDCSALFANGKGISELASQASALGEFIERLGTHYLFADYWLGGVARLAHGFVFHPQERSLPTAHFKRDQMLSPELWQWYDPDHDVTAEQLVSLQEGDQTITALPFTLHTTGETVYFPVNLLNTLYASNGMAAGNTATEAKIQALSEIFERYTRAQVLRNQWCLPVMPRTAWEHLDSVVSMIEHLASFGIRVDIRDASLGGIYPVVAVILQDEIEGKCFVSFGAHPLYEVALERTLTESLQGRVLTERDGFEYPSLDSDFVSSEENLEAHFIDASGYWHLSFFGDQADFTAVPWNHQGDLPAQWNRMCSIVSATGHQLYEQVQEELSNALGVAVVRLIVPAMSEIYPVSDLLDGNANRGLVLQKALNAIDWEKDRSFERLLAVIEEEGYPAHTRVASLIGLLPDKGSAWETLTISELRMGCLLYLGDFSAAQEALSEVFALERDTLFYRALDMMLTLWQNEQLTETARNQQLLIVERLIGEERAQALVNWFQGETFIWDLGLVNPYAYSARHQALTRAFEQVNAVYRR